jgi:hypothetical protein
MNKGILNHIHRIEFAAKLLTHTKPNYPADPLGVDAA